MATHAPARVARGASLHGVYVILNEDARTLELARAALGAGIGLLQYRAKSGIVAENLRGLRELSRAAGALLIVNDDWRAALDFDCDGVHLGPGDDGFADVAPVRAAMRDRLIGLSCGTLAELQNAGTLDVDYAGVGSVYATASKGDAGEPIGIDGLRALVANAALPVAAVGGLTLATLPEVRKSGAAMAAVISALAGARDPSSAARELVAQWQ